MTAVWIVMVIFGSLVLILGTICGTILLAMKLRHGGFSARSREAQGEEARMIQEIYQGLSRMEARVEALETILMEHKERSQRDHDEQTL
jgi:phage shock protein B